MKKKKINSTLSFIVVLLISPLILSLILPSCSSRKVYGNLEIERLFMQTAKPDIEFQDNGGLPGQSGPRSISEEVSFTNAEDLFLEENEVLASQASKLDTSKVYKISEVEVKVKSHFAPERDGRVNLDFQIVAPVDVLDPNWRLVFAPILIDGDSVCPLDTVYLVGEGFKDKQIADYEAYDDFLSTIIDSSAYDSLFVNWKTLYKEMNKEQRRNYNKYKEQYDLIKRYEDWKRMNEMEFLSMEALALRHKRHMYSKYWRKAESEILKAEDKKKEVDAVSVHRKYDEKYKKDYVAFLKNKFSLHWLDSVSIDLNIHAQKDSILQRSHVPGRYREVHAKGLTLNDIHAKPFTPADSARIAKHHYMIDEIVLNELNISRKDDIFKEIVEFPYRESSEGVRADSVITAEEGIIYHYNQQWPVKPGMKNLKIVMESKVEAVDRSTFIFEPSDTLTFYITSLSQLVDESLVTERKQLYKYLFRKGQVYPKYRTRKAHKFDESLNKGAFDQMLETYHKYASDSEFTVDSVTVLCSVDLLGSWQDNYEQSYYRADEIAKYLSKKVNVPVVIKPKGEDWNSLVKEIKSRADLPNATAILDTLATAVYPDQTEETIKRLYPNDYKIIRDEIYPKLNRVDYYINFCRPGIDKDTIQETHREDYAEAIQLLKSGEYVDAFKMLAKYGDYNVALCLVCLGYNEKAQEVLEKLPETAKNEYLLSIVYARLENDAEASKRLLNACKLDPSLYYRISLDSEVNGLANRANLWPQLSKY